MKVRRVDLGEISLVVAEAGAGGRPLLLVHGFGGAKEDFTEFVDDLADLGWHTVVPDLRGHGDSDQPDDESAYSFDAFAGDLLALADALGWDRLVLLGHSMGGMVAQFLVLARPERVGGLILMDTTHGPTDWIDSELSAFGATILREHGIEEYVRISNELRDNDPLLTPAHARLLRERAGYADFCDWKALSSSAAMRLAMMPLFLSQADRLDQLATLQLPTLILAGEQDVDFVPHAERMAKTIPGAQLAVIADAGHSPQFEAPDGWWSALTAFLDQVAQVGRG